MVHECPHIILPYTCLHMQLKASQRSSGNPMATVDLFSHQSTRGISPATHVYFPLTLPFSLHPHANVSWQGARATLWHRSLISLGIA